MKTKCINLYGGPGTGKSTTSAGLFYFLKLKGMNVELATEWIKEKIWADLTAVAQNQLYVFAKQHNKFCCLQGKVDGIITDSPLALSLYYARNTDEPEELFSLVKRKINDFDNIHIFLRRVKQYNPSGRTQTEEQARLIDNEVLTILKDIGETVYTLDADADAAPKLADAIFSCRQNSKEIFEKHLCSQFEIL